MWCVLKNSSMFKIISYTVDEVFRINNFEILSLSKTKEIGTETEIKTVG